MSRQRPQVVPGRFGWQVRSPRAGHWRASFGYCWQRGLGRVAWSQSHREAAVRCTVDDYGTLVAVARLDVWSASPSQYMEGAA